MAEPVAGEILAGKYRIERVLGRGGMGVVVQAHHIVLSERVAIKFLLTDQVPSADTLTRFLREAKAAARIKSQHVARVTDIGTLEDGAPYMVMEYLEGRDLSQLLETERMIRTEDAVDYIVQACDAIAEAHSAGIVHRDIKPANLFLARHHDGSPLVKVLDFGISKVSSPDEPDGITRTAAIMGSALYMSPEQLQRTKGVDHRTDIYALGISLYELLTCRQPFEAETLPELAVAIVMGEPTPLGQLRPDLDPQLIAVIEKAFARDLGQRFQNVGDLVLALQPFAPARSGALIERIARATGGSGTPYMNPRGSYGGLPDVSGAPQGAGYQTGGAAPGYQTGGQQPVGANTDLSSVQAAVGQPARAKWPFGVAALGVLALGTAAVGVVMVQGARATPEPPSAAASNATPPEPDLLAATSGAVPAPEPAPELSQKGEAAPSAEPRAQAPAQQSTPVRAAKPASAPARTAPPTAVAKPPKDPTPEEPAPKEPAPAIKPTAAPAKTVNADDYR